MGCPWRQESKKHRERWRSIVDEESICWSTFFESLFVWSFQEANLVEPRKRRFEIFTRHWCHGVTFKKMAKEQGVSHGLAGALAQKFAYKLQDLLLIAQKKANKHGRGECIGEVEFLRRLDKFFEMLVK